MAIERVNPHGMTGLVVTFDDLCLFLGGSRDSWTGDLLRLIAKSDPEHRAALRQAFPVISAVWAAWNTGAPLGVDELTALATPPYYCGGGLSDVNSRHAPHQTHDGRACTGSPRH